MKIEREIDLNMFDLIMASLMADFHNNKDQIRELIAHVAPDIDYRIWRTFLYADCMSGNPNARNHRFSLFVMMYEESNILKSNDSLAYDFFIESYHESSNIYKQLQDTPFDIRGFLKKMKAEVHVASKLDDKSREWYNKLPNEFKVYRGLSKAEKDARKFGVSWTVDAAYAERYLHLKDNEVEGDIGYVACMTICKEDVIAVQYEFHPEICFEVITLKDDSLSFREVNII